MDETLKILNGVRRQIAAHDDALQEARSRRDAVLAEAAKFPGVLRVYRSGSLAAGLMNHPVTDGDCGVVLDRRVYPELGPDGDEVGPFERVRAMLEFIQQPLRQLYPSLKIDTMKRGLLIEPRKPLDEEQDPTVDLVIALNRRDDDALWIPCIDWKGEGVHWDGGHPERHLEMLRMGGSDLVRVRAHVIRLGKAWKNQFSPAGMCSFNVVALALEAIRTSMPLPEALLLFFSHASSELAKGDTMDPAGVSGAIHLDDLPGRETVVRRLEAAARGLSDALRAGNDPDAVLEALQPVFFDYLKPPTSASSKAALAEAIRRKGDYGLGRNLTLAHAAGVTTRVEPSRSFGDHA